jgi:hypothetical protein
VRVRINENILWLDVSVAYAKCVNVGNRPHELVSIEFDKKRWNHLFHLEIVLHDFVDSLGDVVHDNVEINLFRLRC